ncbi:MAG: DNA-directed DNA polymerase II small subunit [Candidatus Micrarchaeia archaeon]
MDGAPEGSLKLSLLKALSERERACAPDALDFLATHDEPLVFLDDFLSSQASGQAGFVLSLSELKSFADSRLAQKSAMQVTDIVAGSVFQPPSRSVVPQFALSINNSDVTGKSRCTGTVDDFVNYFGDRYRRLSAPLRNAASSEGFSTLRDLKQGVSGKKARVVGIIYSKKITKNGHMLFEIEDETGLAPCLVSRDSPLFAEANTLLTDEVVAFDVYAHNDLLIAKAFFKPGRVFQERRKTKIAKDVSIAFLSDLHVGSKLFMQEKFKNFLRFLNGEGSEELREQAGKIKYISIAGDLTDGIGVYPSQEKELLTKDIFTQYEIFCEFLKGIPEYIEVIVAPGNHDAVRTAEPQPCLPEEFTRSLRGYDNIHFVGNPSVHKIEGLDLLIYHGTSVDGIISNSPALKNGYDFPERVAQELLNKRHLCPIYGEDPLVPEARDYLVIEGQPDIFHFGHVHKNGYNEDYFGTVIVNSGTWQSQTDFQIRMGHNPTPCILPIYDMHTGKMETLDFNKIEF